MLMRMKNTLCRWYLRENDVEMTRIEGEISHNNVLNCDNWNGIQSRTEEEGEGEGEGDDIGESEIPSHPNVDDDDNNINEENNQIGDDCSCVSESNHVGKVSEEECHSTEKQCSSLISQITQQQQQTIPVSRTQHNHRSTNHPSFNPTQSLQLHRKQQTPFVIEGIDGSSVSHSSQTNITSFSSTDKFDSISSFTHSNCVDFKSFYKWLDQDNLFP